MKIKLFILEVNQADWNAMPVNSTWELPLGSGPRKPGELVEGMTVPEGKVWLFPSGSNFTALEKFIKGERIVKSVNI